jgi:hypothetical protein
MVAVTSLPDRWSRCQPVAGDGHPLVAVSWPMPGDRPDSVQPATEHFAGLLQGAIGEFRHPDGTQPEEDGGSCPSRPEGRPTRARAAW